MANEPFEIELTPTGWSDDELLLSALETPAFELYEQRLEVELSELVSRWRHRAAPNAHSLRRSAPFPSANPVNMPR